MWPAGPGFAALGLSSWQSVALAVVVAILIGRAVVMNNADQRALGDLLRHELEALGLPVRSVTTGMDGNPGGSHECGVHAVAEVATSSSAEQLEQRLELSGSEARYFTVLPAQRSGLVEVVAWELGSGGAAGLWDFRCTGPPPHFDPASWGRLPAERR